MIGNLENFNYYGQHSQHQSLLGHQPLIETSLNLKKTMTPKKHSMQARVKECNANKDKANYILAGVHKLQAFEKENGADIIKCNKSDTT